jgi:hypothetical protein
MNKGFDRNHGEINRRQWRHNCHRGAYERELAPGTRPSADAHATLPHPNKHKRKQGWRIEVIFLGLLMSLAPIAYVLIMFAK